jgi:murein DD-endopeptidase MepM/ murein hydrolase activator NlpD
MQYLKTLGAVLLLGILACATPKPASSPAMATRPSMGSTPASPNPPPIARSKTISGQPSEKLDTELSAAIEDALVRFIAANQSNDAPGRTNKTWSKATQLRWQQLLAFVQDGLHRGDGLISLRALVQCRVILETELENASRRYGPPPKLIQEQVTAQYIRIARLRRTAPGWKPIPEQHISFDWPVSPVIITSYFGYRQDPITRRQHIRFHAGLDLGGNHGDIVNAAAKGSVISVGRKGGHGNTVVVRHDRGYTTRYSHLRRILVKPGERIEVGIPIGLMGQSGRATGPHLHFEIRRNGQPVDPLELIQQAFALSQ